MKTLEEYNANLPQDASKLSILKSYNNQDGEFSEIDQYPGQLGEVGALLKLFKYKFIVGGPNAQRPVMFVDGDESFTKTGTEFTIGHETSLKRENNEEFFKKFNVFTCTIFKLFFHLFNLIFFLFPFKTSIHSFRFFRNSQFTFFINEFLQQFKIF